MSPLALQSAIFAEQMLPYQLLYEFLQRNQVPVYFSAATQTFNPIERHALIYVTESLFEKNAELFTRYVNAHAPIAPLVILLDPTATHKYQNNPVITDILLSDAAPHLLENQLFHHIKLAHHEFVLEHSLKKHKNIAASLDNDKQITKCMFDKLCQLSCFDSPHLNLHFSEHALYQGDIFLAARKPNGNLQILLGDFSGAGLSTALGALPISESFYGMTAKGFGFESILREINMKLFKVLPREIFCAAALIEIDFKKLELKLWNGGLPDLILTNDRNQIITRFASNHTPLGIKDDTNFLAHIIITNPGPTDFLYIYTKTIFKLENDYHHPLGEQGFVNLFSTSTPPEQMMSHLGKNFLEYSKNPINIAQLCYAQINFLASTQDNLIDIESNSEHSAKPMDWSLELLLLPFSLRNFDPLPILLHILMEQPSLDAHRSRIYAILAELFSNALDHGVLGLNSEDKASAIGFANYYKKRTDALNHLKNAYIKIKLSNTAHPSGHGWRLIIVIEDSGPGFNYKKDRVKHEDNVTYSGRGITMIQEICESVRYYGRGNCVEIVYHWT